MGPTRDRAARDPNSKKICGYVYRDYLTICTDVEPRKNVTQYKHIR